VDDVVGGGQVEPGAAGTQADQEQISLAGLESGDRCAALRLGGRAIEILVADATGIEMDTEELEVIDKLTEDQCLVTIVEQFVDDLGEGLELGARQFAVG